MSALSF